MFVILNNTSNIIIVTKYKNGSSHIFCKLPIIWTTIRGVIGWSWGTRGRLKDHDNQIHIEQDDYS